MSSGIFRLDQSTVRCPLCLDFFSKKYDSGRQMFVLVCDTDKIGIACKDPFVNRWDQAEAHSQPIDCPSCGSKMRCFFTSTGYFKAKCVKKKCSTAIAVAQPDRKTDDARNPDTPLEVKDRAPEIDRPVATPDNPGLVQ